jgi:hypothetical protein
MLTKKKENKDGGAGLFYKNTTQAHKSFIFMAALHNASFKILQQSLRSSDLTEQKNFVVKLSKHVIK